MQRKSFSRMQCPVARSLEQVGEWWSMLILRDAFLGLRRFEEFQQSLSIAPNMLTRRLAKLVESGLLERRQYGTHSRRFEYLLTERGRSFRPVLLTLLDWGNRHLATEGKAVQLIDTQTGREAQPLLVDEVTGLPLSDPALPRGGGPRRRCPPARALHRRGPQLRRPHGRRTRREYHMSTQAAAAVPDFHLGRAIRARLTKRALLVLGALFAASAALAATTHWWSVGRFLEATDDAYVGGDVTVIAPKVQGFIATIPVEDNQAVHAGDVLATLDDRDFAAAKARAAAGVQGQLAQLQNIAATRQLQHAVIDQAQAEIASADAEWDRARQDQQRYGNLVDSAAVSRQAFERADATLKQAAAERERARAALQAAQRQLDVLATQEMQAHAALAGANAELQSAELNLGYTVLRAPIDGVVGNRAARVGAYATTGTRLLSIIPASGLWVDANFKESQLAHIRPGDPATVVADILPGQVLHGHVHSLAAATGSQFSLLPTENATGNFTKIVQRVPVRILLDARDAARVPLLPGLSVTAEVDTHASPRS